MCHSDLHVVDGVGRFPLDRPIILGHEGSGVVEAVGADVTTLRPGDHVVACLSGFCGSCEQCLGGHAVSVVGSGERALDVTGREATISSQKAPASCSKPRCATS